MNNRQACLLAFANGIPFCTLTGTVLNQWNIGYADWQYDQTIGARSRSKQA